MVDGLVELNATLQDPADSDAAIATVGQLRQAVRTADFQVGPPPPTWTPARPTSATGRSSVPSPTITAVFALLLRPWLAPLLLTATVVLEAAATLGIAALAFNQLFDSPSAPTPGWC